MSKDIQADMALTNNASYTVVKKAVKILTEKICQEVRTDTCTLFLVFVNYVGL